MLKQHSCPESTSVLIIIPPYFNADDFVDKQKSAILPAFTVPYGVLSLNAYLSKNCISKILFTVLDLNIDLKKMLDDRSQGNWADCFEEKIIESCRETQPDIVGISALFNSSFKYLEQNAAIIKKQSTDTLVVAGGGLPSAAYKNILETSPSIDAVCKGEGELPMRALIDSLDRWEVLATHKSWITKKDALAGKVPTLDFVENLDDIPKLNYESLNLDYYNSRSIDKRFADSKRREMSIHTSRGCPFSCVFCSNPSLHGKAVRTMSVKRVVSDVKQMRDKFGMDVLLIEDDHFFNNVDRAKDILRGLIELKIRIEFPNGVAVYAISDEIAQLFGKAGVSSVALAVESGSDHVLKNIIKKPLKKKLIKPAVEHLRRYGIMSHVFIVIGLPGEMQKHRDETLEMLINTGFDWVHIFCAIPIYGSRLYDICVENNYIEDASADDYITTKSLIRAPGVDPEQIHETSYEMNLTVNFLNNFNVKNGNFQTAEYYFRNVCDKYPNHMFGQLYLSQVLKTQNKNEWKERLNIAKSLYATDTFWQNKVAKYNILHLLN
jgi:radical SAM superfamily enzyme YgiQ (UPF0313 family)